ncbi:MAG: DUF721 domain-containing protein [Silicimonas sp.]|nr:DUF721 domain-containing protein [Silicimonas sp.]NND21581.1 DUF721 domain-containing protein [Silicimonas sp.]NND41190.1 DUF721 domain-containing protein [Silicimonas sp.]NNE60531.1 DUF721 domain-containing protein [Woeseia sp.]
MSGARQDFAAKRRRRGFERASQLVAQRVRTAGESRGFAVTRLLTHWPDIVGSEIATAARPVEIGYGKGFGATLTLLTNGAQAPIIEMQKETIREKVNACYGYAAIQRIRLTQTAATGFEDGRMAAATPTRSDQPAEPAIPEQISIAARGVGDDDLRKALERLGANVISRKK